MKSGSKEVVKGEQREFVIKETHLLKEAVFHFLEEKR